MHEVGISEALLDQLSSLATRHGWVRVRRVWVRMGLLSGVVPDALAFAFEAMASGTPAEGAELVIESGLGRFSCAGCGEMDLGALVFSCPECGGPLQLLDAGRELLLCGVEPLD